jgi:hypothetical protein
LLAVATPMLSQTAARAPVILSDRGGDPGPQPGPDPSGVYSGQVTFTFGNEGSFTQNWKIPLKSQACPSCQPGQYLFGGTNYDLIEYDSGAFDRGGVSGSVSGDGTGYLELFGTNCGYITSGLGGASTYRSGRAGPSPGADFKVSNGRMTGRLSGYECFGRLVTADLDLRRETGVQPRTCAYFGGIYFGSYANSCGGSQTGDAILTQSGCAISGFSAGAATAIQATITSATTATFDFESTAGCGSGSGTATISNGVIRGTYSGDSPGGSGCCQPGPFSGSFTLSP